MSKVSLILPTNFLIISEIHKVQSLEISFRPLQRMLKLFLWDIKGPRQKDR